MLGQRVAGSGPGMGVREGRRTSANPLSGRGDTDQLCLLKWTKLRNTKFSQNEAQLSLMPSRSL